MQFKKCRRHTPQGKTNYNLNTAEANLLKVWAACNVKTSKSGFCNVPVTWNVKTVEKVFCKEQSSRLNLKTAKTKILKAPATCNRKRISLGTSHVQFVNYQRKGSTRYWSHTGKRYKLECKSIRKMIRQRAICKEQAQCKSRKS